MRILAIIAHPDYSALFIGGTIIKHVQQGDEVKVISLSPGEGGAAYKYPNALLDELYEIKKLEIEAVSTAQGVKEVRVLHFPDTKIENTPELRATIIDIIREIKPDVVLTHWPQDGHPDVRETAQAVVDACFFAYLPGIHTAFPPHQVHKAFAFYETASSENFEPDFFIDITEVVPDKIRAAECNQAMVEEIKALFSENWADIFLGPNRHWGAESGVCYAEPFKELKIHGLGKRALGRFPV
jgi:N-acetylglucosamine malate deacetylase 1